MRTNEDCLDTHFVPALLSLLQILTSVKSFALMQAKLQSPIALQMVLRQTLTPALSERYKIKEFRLVVMGERV